MDRQLGRRERKKQQTRETIARVGLELFAERGYQATTLADIADAADVSTRTIFAYYPTKEDILFCEFPAMKEAFARALAERPPGTDALQTLRDFAVSSAHQDKGPFNEQSERIIDSDETLRSHKRARLAEIEELVASAIAQDLDAAEDDLRPQLAAASLIAAIGVLDRRAVKASTPDDVAAVLDPVIAFLRAGIEALTPASERSARAGAARAAR